MKVLMVEIAGRGGICHYTFNLCRSLSRSTEVVLFTGAGYELAALGPGFTVREVFDRFRTRPSALYVFLRELARRDTVVHFQLSQYPGFVLLLCVIARLAGRPVVVTAHNVFSHERRIWEKAVYGMIYRLSSRIIVHARNNRDELSLAFPGMAQKTAVIPHGNYMFFNRQEGRPAPAEPGHNLLFFGYIRPYKGLMHLIRSLAAVRVRFPRVRLFIVGRPVGDFTPYREEIRRLGLEGNVSEELSYIPFEKVAGYFRGANIVVLPYLKVYQSGVLQLAYGFSRPVIVTDTGGMAEAVEEGKSGFVVPPGDEAALADRLIAFFSDPVLQRQMGEYAWSLCDSKFSWERIARMTDGLYNGLRWSATVSCLS